MTCCASEASRKEGVLAMSHDERLAYAKKMKYAGMGMITCGIGCFAGLTGGLWASMGAGALGVGFGSASGLLFGSLGLFSTARETLNWDAEAESKSLAA